MGKNKDRKVRIGQGRPTENRAVRSTIEQATLEWLAKVDAADNSVNGIQSRINAVASVFTEMAKQIRVGALDFEVMTKVVARRNVTASLQKAFNGRYVELPGIRDRVGRL